MTPLSTKRAVAIAASERAVSSRGTSAPPVRCGVYVHVPFCRRRCSYCDFYFEVAPEDPRYPAAVVDELARRSGELPGPPATLSFGGGTPSRLATASLGAIIDAVRVRTGLVTDAEVSLEANPEDVGDDVARAWRAAGVSRVSFGVQSFDDDVLRWLGRAHDGARARAAVRAAIDAGIPHVGIDLIVGVPAERAGRLVADVDAARMLGVGHVSTYLLTVEEGTPLVALIKRGARAPVDDDRQADAYEEVQRLLPARGYAQYEISSYALPGDESAHNRLYWSKGDYLGLGPGAHSARLLQDGGVARRHTTARLAAWLEAPGAAFDEERLDPDHALLEAVAFGLRDLGAGVDVAALEERHCTAAPAGLARALARCDARGFVEHRGARWFLTTIGARFADAVGRDVLAARDDA